MTTPWPSASVEAVDAWQLAGLPGGLREASYLTVSSTERTGAQYRALVDVLLAQQQESLTGIGLDELADLLGAHVRRIAGDGPAAELLGEMDLESRMTQLVRWGVVKAWDDRSLRPDDFLRNATRYQLSATGAQLHRAVLSLGADDQASLAAVFAPGVLVGQLVTLTDALATEPVRAAEAWAVIRTTLDGMARAAQGWQSSLADALAGAPDPAKVGALQETLERYLTVWGTGIDTHSDAIARSAADLLARAEEQWRAVALVGIGVGAADAQVDVLVAGYRATMTTLEAWFAGSNGQARRLRRQMRDAIAPMLRGRRTLAAVGGHVTRRSELLALAASLEGCADDAEAWRLWCTATGLFAARHLALESPEPGGPAASLSFWDAPPTEVAVRLRAQGPRSLSGTAARIPDRREGRRLARNAAAAARLREAEIVSGIVRRSGTWLSTWSDLSRGQLDALLVLLAAVAAARHGVPGPVEARSGDGRWLVRAEPAGPDDPPAVVHALEGRLVHPDLRLTVLRSPGDELVPALGGEPGT